MFDKEIKFIVDFNLNKIRKSGTFFTLDKLVSTGVHPSIIKYISAELDLMIFEDRKRLLNNSMFDYSGGEISKHFVQINREIKRNKRLAFEDLKKLVIQAVSFNANHVVRPRWSLTKLIFDPSPSRTVEEIKLILEYSYYYNYTKNLFISYLNKKKLVTLNQNEFDEVYTKADHELFSAGGTKLLDNALSSMSDFFNEGGAVKNKLSPELVLIFLKEKGLTEYSSRLRQAIPPDVKQKYSINEIRSIIFGFTPEEEPHPAPAEKEADIQGREELEIETENEIIDTLKNSPVEEAPSETTFVKVVSKIPVKGEEDNNDEVVPSGEQNIIYKSEEEVAEEINLPIVEDISSSSPQQESLKSSDIPAEEENYQENEIDLDREVSIILPDEEIKEIYDDKPEKEITGEDVVTDEDEIKFDLQAKEKLNELYEFEEEKEDELKEEEEYPPFNEQEFNLKELESELKQIEEEFNIPSEPAIEKKTAPAVSRTSGGDVFKFLTNKEIDRIISNIFNDDRDDFTNTLERISECDNYDKATEILKSVFLTYRINPYSRDAVSLTNAVSKYFEMK